jgi:hypothetical protein
MKATVLCGLLAATVLMPAHAQEVLRTYDNFGGATIDPKRWTDSERVRALRRGTLNLVQRETGVISTASHVEYSHWSIGLTNPERITALRSKIMVNAIEVPFCPSFEEAGGHSVTALVGNFFKGSGPYFNTDVQVRLEIDRSAASVDPVGVLRVRASIVQCSGDQVHCDEYLEIDHVDLGTVPVGQATTVQMQWDEPNRRFLFAREETGQNVTLPYVHAIAGPPTVPVKALSTRLDLANCSPAPTQGLVDASFDNVSVNRSAAP